MTVTPTNTTSVDPSHAPATPWEAVLDSHGGDVGRALSAIFAGRPGGDVRPGDGATLEIWRAPVGAGANTRTLDPWDGAAPGSEGYDGANPLAPWILTDGSEHDGAIASPFAEAAQPIRHAGWVAEGPKVIVLPTYHYDPSKKDGHFDDPDGTCPDEIVFDDEEGEVFTPDDDEPTEIVFEDDEGMVITPGGDERREDGVSVSAPDLLGMVQGLLSSGVAFTGGLDAGLTERLLGGKAATADAFVFELSGGAGGVDALSAGFEALAGFAGAAATAALKQAFAEASARGDLDGVAVLAVTDGDAASWAAVDFDDWL